MCGRFRVERKSTSQVYLCRVSVSQVEETFQGRILHSIFSTYQCVHKGLSKASRMNNKIFVSITPFPRTFVNIEGLASKPSLQLY